MQARVPKPHPNRTPTLSTCRNVSAILSGEARTGGEPSTSIRTGSAAGGLGYEGKSRFLTVELFGRANVESVARPGASDSGAEARILIGLYGTTEVGPFP